MATQQLSLSDLFLQQQKEKTAKQKKFQALKDLEKSQGITVDTLTQNKYLNSIEQFANQFENLELISSSQRFRTLTKRYGVQELEIHRSLSDWIQNLLNGADTYRIRIETKTNVIVVCFDTETGKGFNYSRRQCWLRFKKPSFEFLRIRDKNGLTQLI